jgi:ABC-2 type transport system ATP-binding protein
MGKVVDVYDLKKSFLGQEVVHGVSLSIQEGEVFGVLGPNGSGKTTTLRMLCGLLVPDSGYGTCLGYDLLTQPALIKMQVGYMTQRFSLYSDLSVKENLDFIARIYGVLGRVDAVDKIIKDMGFSARQNQLAGELSGGWKQRLALAACLIHQPKLLLLDEPTAGVDPIARREFWDKIHSLSHEGITTLVSTHYMDEAERCTRLAYFSSGSLLMTGTVNEVIDATHLLTFVLTPKHPNTLIALLNQAAHLSGVIQSALFGNQIHVCGYDKTKIEKALEGLAVKYEMDWRQIPTTLEDAFISLVNQKV